MGSPQNGERCLRDARQGGSEVRGELHETVRREIGACKTTRAEASP